MHHFVMKKAKRRFKWLRQQFYAIIVRTENNETVFTSETVYNRADLLQTINELKGGMTFGMLVVDETYL